MDEQLTRERVLAMPVGVEIDALVAARVMGQKVFGFKNAWAPDGCWSICREGIGELRPVYLQSCLCDIREPGDDALNEMTYGFAELGGHMPNCLGVVKHYSTDIAAAWEVVNRAGIFWRLQTMMLGKRCSAAVCGAPEHPNSSKALHHEAIVWEANQMSLAICRAALLTIIDE